jgi:hypothetical protein
VRARKARALATAETVCEGPTPFLARKLNGAYSKHRLFVYSGREIIGSLLPRREGVEAFTADNQSLGIFSNQQTAADAISMVAS